MESKWAKYNLLMILRSVETKTSEKPCAEHHESNSSINQITSFANNQMLVSYKLNSEMQLKSNCNTVYAYKAIFRQ